MKYNSKLCSTAVDSMKAETGQPKILYDLQSGRKYGDAV